MGWNNWHHMMGGYGLFGGGLVSLLILGALIVAVVLLIRNSSSSGNSQAGIGADDAKPQRQTPIDILETRYAKGEIDREEYLERRHDLEHTRVPPS